MISDIESAKEFCSALSPDIFLVSREEIMFVFFLFTVMAIVHLLILGARR